ncbi:MAG TPA: isoleucine--tRNA ligase [Candidatus Saccharimonadales bacterium]|nr:isoleucine--tRNA ligase [Candidatus Saccharimonadales bacterium]
MKYRSGTRRRALEYEKDLVQYWKDNKTFEKSVEMRPEDNRYVFYDGPPFITGVPHHGTLLSSIAKDVVPRYWTMQGRRVERTWGWDCHGLPAEVFTEKKLGIADRRDIGTKISLEEYTLTCRENMVATGSLWEDTIDRIGRWVDFKGAYKTMDRDYMESVWWAFKELYDKGKIYEGERVLLYCTRDATPLSKAEVTMDAGNYKDVSDPSVFVKFKLTEPDADGQPVSLLAWTTTPWTLPANTAVAVGEDIEYAEVELEVDASGSDLDQPQRLILAKELLDKVLTNEKHQVLPYTVLRTLKGHELLGKSYEPLFAHRGDNAHKVWIANYVTVDDGTGIVHLAPAYGEEDYELSKKAGFPFVSIIDENGFYTEGDWQGQNVWEANKPIAKELHARGVVWKIDYIMHSYPHCYRCGTRLMYRAHPSWFVDINGQKQLMLDENENINWFPPHIKHGRFQKNIEQAPDWNISRDRFWATAMPVWKGTDADGNTRDAQGREYVKVVGSYDELKELSGEVLADYHRPWVDDIEFDLDGVHYKRIPNVMDCWFESGSMPFAQLHYPFENKEKFEATFPGDFIVEYVGQVRAWFYYVHAVNTALFGQNAYKNVITTGTLAGNDGRKMSKSYGNYTDPNELMDQYSADSLRFLLMSSPLMGGEDYALLDKNVADTARKLSMVWNMYDFFTLYAEVDGWEWDGKFEDPSGSLSNPLDVWIVSRVHQLLDEVEENMNRYDIPNAMKPILPFLDDASNWYVRRSRRRFWKSEDDGDKNDAYRTLHYVLLMLSHVLAPFTPFLAEELFLKLTGEELGESVHLRDWPKAGTVNAEVIRDMAEIRKGIEQGLSQRAAAKIKVRQPLQKARVYVTKMPGPGEYQFQLAQIVAEELNVKDGGLAEVLQVDGAAPDRAFETELDLEITPELKREGMMREVIRQVQNARKQAGLNVDDRIRLELDTHDSELKQAIAEHTETITAETLATSLETSGSAAAEGYTADVTVDGAVLAIALQKAK